MAMVDGHGSPYRHCHRPLPSTFSLQPLTAAALRLWCRAAFIAVELLDDLGREVEAGRRPRDARLSRVEHEVQALFRGELVEDRRHLLDEVVLHFLLQLVDLGLRILLEALGFLLLPLDFLLELAARRLVHHAAAGLQLLLVRLELLGLVGVLGLLLLDERLHAGERGLAFRRILEHDFRLEERDLRPRRERRGRLRRRRGSGRCRRRRRRGLRRFRLGGCRLLRRLRLLGGRLGEHGGGAQRTGERRGNGVTFHPSLVLSSVLEVLDSTPFQKVDPTANRNWNAFCACSVLSSTPARCGLNAKMRRNGTLSTGMKNRTSRPVDVFQSCMLKLWPGFTTVAIDPPCGTYAGGPTSVGPPCTWPAS